MRDARASAEVIAAFSTTRVILRVGGTRPPRASSLEFSHVAHLANESRKDYHVRVSSGCEASGESRPGRPGGAPAVVTESSTLCTHASDGGYEREDTLARLWHVREKEREAP